MSLPVFVITLRRRPNADIDHGNIPSSSEQAAIAKTASEVPRTPKLLEFDKSALGLPQGRYLRLAKHEIGIKEHWQMAYSEISAWTNKNCIMHSV
jgi:hypothetical protein